MAEADDYLANLRSVGTNTSITAKPRQGIKMDPTDDAHMATHQAPPVFRYRDSAEVTPGGMADGSDAVTITKVPIGPQQ